MIGCLIESTAWRRLVAPRKWFSPPCLPSFLSTVSFSLFVLDYLELHRTPAALFPERRSRSCNSEQRVHLARQPSASFIMLLLLLFLLVSPSFPLRCAASSLLAAMDRSADPCKDFFQFACGTWNKMHVIPEDRSSISTFEVGIRHRCRRRRRRRVLWHTNPTTPTKARDLIDDRNSLMCSLSLFLFRWLACSPSLGLHSGTGEQKGACRSAAGDTEGRP